MKYLSAEELKITESERTLLIRAADLLAKTKVGQAVCLNDSKTAFDMSMVLEKGRDFIRTPDGKYQEVKCKTVGCIKGWMTALSKNPAKELGPSRDSAGVASWAESKVLEKLFYPMHVEMHRVTPKIAASVAKKFLQTGKVKWPEKVF